MLHYEIIHYCDIPPEQKRNLAVALTSLHCRTFSAPSIFVNVTFQHYTSEGWTAGKLGCCQTVFVGGRRVHTNYIHAHIRPRTPHNQAKLNTLTTEIMRLWDEIIVRSKPSRGSRYKPKEPPGRLGESRALHNVFIMQDIAAGAEQGFILPIAGEDGKWIEENMAEFERRAKDGDESMRALAEEVKTGLGSGPVLKSKL